MATEKQMGDITQLAYNFIEEDLLVMNDELDPEVVLDFLQDGDNFKRISDLLKETMINVRIPRDVKKAIRAYPTVDSFLQNYRCDKLTNAALCESDSSNAFINSLFALLSRQEEECVYGKRKHSWNRPTISRWFSTPVDESSSCISNSESIRSRDDAIAICFALGLDYDASREFINKCGHALFNIRNPEDAVYIYCLLNKRPLSAAREMIHNYYKASENDSIPNAEVKLHSGDTTLFLTNQILGDTSWQTDEDFFTTFLLPNKGNFISYSRTILKEYYKLKNPIYLSVLKTRILYENNDPASGFNLRRIQEHIHKIKKDHPISISMKDVQVTYNFINNLEKYAPMCDLLKKANEMLDIHVERIAEKEWHEEDFKTINNSVDVVDFITDAVNTHSENELEQKIISDFLTDTVTAYRMLCEWLPSVAGDDDEWLRQKSFDKSPLKNTVLANFPRRHFFTIFEKHPEKLVHDMSIRKAIILLYYMNYARNLIQEITNPNSIAEMEFGFENFIENMNEILGKCQLGKLYYANQFDWLILESIKKLENYYDEDDTEGNPISFLDKVIDFSFDDDPYDAEC